MRISEVLGLLFLAVAPCMSGCEPMLQRTGAGVYQGGKLFALEPAGIDAVYTATKRVFVQMGLRS
jgi:hypothetical protein